MSTLAWTEYQGITLLKRHWCLIYNSVYVCDQDRGLSGLTAGFAVAGDAAAAGSGAGAAAVFSASAGFAIQLFTRPDTPPLIPAKS